MHDQVLPISVTDLITLVAAGTASLSPTILTDHGGQTNPLPAPEDASWSSLWSQHAHNRTPLADMWLASLANALSAATYQGGKDRKLFWTKHLETLATIVPSLPAKPLLGRAQSPQDDKKELYQICTSTSWELRTARQALFGNNTEQLLAMTELAEIDTPDIFGNYLAVLPLLLVRAQQLKKEALSDENYCACMFHFLAQGLTGHTDHPPLSKVENAWRIVGDNHDGMVRSDDEGTPAERLALLAQEPILVRIMFFRKLMDIVTSRKTLVQPIETSEFSRWCETRNNKEGTYYDALSLLVPEYGAHLKTLAAMGMDCEEAITYLLTHNITQAPSEQHQSADAILSGVVEIA